jgi:hypothetical protein
MDKNIINQYPQQFSGGPYWLGINIGPGWIPIVAHVCQEIQNMLSEDDLRKFHWIQIKEKWGRLTMYWGPKHQVIISAVCPEGIVEFESVANDGNQDDDMKADLSPAIRERIMEIITRAQERASKTCEYCGAEGSIRSWPHISVLCETCNQLTK